MLDLETAILNTLTAEAGTGGKLEGASIKPHGGEFNFEEISKYGFDRRAGLRLVTMGGTSANEPPSIGAWVRFVLYVACEDAAAVAARRRVKAIDFVDASLRIVLKQGQRWGLSEHGIGKADGVAFKNMYSRKIDDRNVALWAITWIQRIDLSDGTNLAVPLERIVTSWIQPGDDPTEVTDESEPGDPL